MAHLQELAIVLLRFASYTKSSTSFGAALLPKINVMMNDQVKYAAKSRLDRRKLLEGQVAKYESTISELRQRQAEDSLKAKKFERDIEEVCVELERAAVYVASLK